MSKWSDDIPSGEIDDALTPRRLVMIITDQQFDYWYDPCGKSGHDLNRYFTRRARKALKLLREKVDRPAPDLVNERLIRHSNDADYLIDSLLASTNTSISMGSCAKAALHRLKDLLWHGRRVEATVLDDIVAETEEKE